MRTPLILSLLLMAQPALAERPTVIELFTSQGCSSCPPADALLRQLAQQDAGLLPLDLHVTYWDRLGWKDPYSLPAVTERQRAASARLGVDGVYTPQVIVDGVYQAVGSDPAEVRRAIATARRDAGPGVALSVTADASGLRVRAGTGAGRGTLMLVGFDRQHVTSVRAGENGGHTLTEVNVVRALAPMGAWDGRALELTAARPEGERFAVLLQRDDGHILAAAVLP